MLSVLTPAKVNLFLNIRPPRGDGFHELCTVMQAVSLWDRLDVTPLAPGPDKLRFTCNLPVLMKDAEKNLVVRAYHAFWQKAGLTPMPLSVHLEKEIPMQAGLGGGSSDAAAMLQVLNHLAFEPLTRQQLHAVAAELGSDVPFFLSGGTQLAQGRGEVLSAVPAALDAGLPMLIIKPRNVNSDTGLAYHRYAREGKYQSQSPEALLNALSHPALGIPGPQRFEALEGGMVNDFEKVLFREYPILDYLRNVMRDCGIGKPVVAGSGSAVFGFLEDNPLYREKISRRFRPDHYQVYWCASHAGGIRQASARP